MERILGLVEELLKELTGVEVIPVFKILCLGENINEFDIAEKLHTNINNTRTLLYKLVNNNLAFSTKKKDKDKGWYIYFWNFNFKHARDLIIERKTRQLSELKQQFGLELKGVMYECPNKHISVSLEKAMEINFRCTECETLLIHKEIGRDKEELDKEIKTIEEDLKLLEGPIDEQGIYKFKQDIQKKYQKGRGKKTKKEKREEKKKALEKKKPKKPVKKSYHGNVLFKGNFYERKKQETDKKAAKKKERADKKKNKKVKPKKSGLFSILKKIKF